ncbi:MAG: tetratricopeptide repeat protein [Planctomycetota bacterium]
MLHPARRKKEKLVFRLTEESRPRLPDDPLPVKDTSSFPADELEFEVAFLEGILDADPYHEDALAFLGHAYTRLGRYEDGLRMDERIVRMSPNNSAALYNLACSYSLLHRIDDALNALERAVENGYSDLTHMLGDEDLVNVRNDPRFANILHRIQVK